MRLAHTETELEKAQSFREKFEKIMGNISLEEILIYQNQLLDGQEELRKQALTERNRAKKLARKLEDLRARILELKEDKSRLEEYAHNDRDLLNDLQECLNQYRQVKSTYDSLMVLLKTTLEKTIGESEIENFDSDTNETRLNFDRYIFLFNITV